MKIEAKNLQVGDQYWSGKTIQEVTRIVRKTKKTIEYRTKRISPNYYDGDLFHRKGLNTKVELTLF